MLFGGSGPAGASWATCGSGMVASGPRSRWPRRQRPGGPRDGVRCGSRAAHGVRRVRWRRPLRDTWLFRYADPGRVGEACFSGIDGDGNGKIGCDDPDCAGSCMTCGDGVCTPPRPARYVPRTVMHQVCAETSVARPMKPARAARAIVELAVFGCWIMMLPIAWYRAAPAGLVLAGCLHTASQLCEGGLVCRRTTSAVGSTTSRLAFSRRAVMAWPTLVKTATTAITCRVTAARPTATLPASAAMQSSIRARRATMAICKAMMAVRAAVRSRRRPGRRPMTFRWLGRPRWRTTRRGNRRSIRCDAHHVGVRWCRVAAAQCGADPADHPPIVRQRSMTPGRQHVVLFATSATLPACGSGTAPAGAALRDRVSAAVDSLRDSPTTPRAARRCCSAG